MAARENDTRSNKKMRWSSVPSAARHVVVAHEESITAVATKKNQHNSESTATAATRSKKEGEEWSVPGEEDADVEAAPFGLVG
mmetsp:Transcript_4017/g.12482  ORF Transcript_4017/g.12482 Transcript_4017/m.12482 type:complete len:83 (-) Transcript_4017:915-1163(-)